MTYDKAINYKKNDAYDLGGIKSKSKENIFA